MKNGNNVKMIVFAPIMYSTLFLVGCGGNVESEFLEKLKADVNEEGERCYSVKNFIDLELLESGGKQYLAVASGSVMNFYKDQQARGVAMVKALQQAGYVGGSTPMKYNYQSHTGYELNDKGREHIIWNKGVCVGRRDVTEIVEYTEPADMRGKTFSEVTYKYDLILNDVVSDLGLEEKVKAKLPGESTAIFTKIALSSPGSLAFTFSFRPRSETISFRIKSYLYVTSEKVFPLISAGSVYSTISVTSLRPTHTPLFQTICSRPLSFNS